MLVSEDELMLLQSQLEGLESIFLELIPLGVELRRQQVQEYYNQRFDQATQPVASVAESELRRQFNTKANQVRNLVDAAESLGDASNRLNLIYAASTLPEERHNASKRMVNRFCKKLLEESTVEQEALAAILADANLTAAEARTVLTSLVFTVEDQLDSGGEPLLVSDLLGTLIEAVSKKQLLGSNDPFLVEARCALEAMREGQD